MKILLLAALVLVAACTKEVSVGTTFPVPVMSRIPAKVGLFLPKELRERVLEEELPKGGAWKVALGEANARFFEQLAAGMFAEVVPASAPYAQGVDLVLVPRIGDYQISTPEESETPYYEAWFRYEIGIHAPDGTLATTWPLTGYGRSEERVFAATEALDDATQRAMRDAAAVAVLELPREPHVKALLDRARAR